jgi:hypothetical protein
MFHFESAGERQTTLRKRLTRDGRRFGRRRAGKERAPRDWPDHPVGIQAMRALKGLDRRLHTAAERAVDRPRVQPERLEPLLELTHFIAVGPERERNHR